MLVRLTMSGFDTHCHTNTRAELWSCFCLLRNICVHILTGIYVDSIFGLQFFTVATLFL